MRPRAFGAVAGCAFALIAILHLMRIALGWSLQFGPHELPVWLSWGVLIGGALLSIWGLALAGKPSRR
jgi:hypothetical protein